MRRRRVAAAPFGPRARRRPRRSFRRCPGLLCSFRESRRRWRRSWPGRRRPTSVVSDSPRSEQFSGDGSDGTRSNRWRRRPARRRHRRPARRPTLPQFARSHLAFAGACRTVLEGRLALRWKSSSTTRRRSCCVIRGPGPASTRRTCLCPKLGIRLQSRRTTSKQGSRPCLSGTGTPPGCRHRLDPRNPRRVRAGSSSTCSTDLACRRSARRRCEPRTVRTESGQ
mmetsp:Transcript_8010/g.19826  ORF Transcript_8010/g.19826 Transcript_8010/m.19826 type:complete len:225 (-) Transcript_8010:8594-9268(-)